MAATTAYYNAHKLEVRARKQAYYRKHKKYLNAQTLAYHYKSKYGLTMAQVKDMYANGCAICGRTKPARSLHVDHNHRTKKVRGTLCRCCNTGVGMFKENVVFLEKAIAYLRQHERERC